MMRNPRMLALAIAACVVLARPVAAQDAFDACTLFTAEDAAKALGTRAEPEPVNPKAKRPKVVLGCAYHGSKDGKPVTATAQFKFARTPDEQAKAFDEARLQLQTKPMILSGADAFWAGKVGQMHVRKGRAWMTLTVGPAAVREREVDSAKRLAEELVKKL
jgi:hypothetical protein